MADYETFVEGGVSFPLSTVSTNSLLQDADPVIFHALNFYETVLNTHIGPRLRKEAQAQPVKMDTAVRMTLSVEPSPFVMQNQMKFPLLALYRKQDRISNKTARWEMSSGTLELVYALPAMHGFQADAINPILHAAGLVLTRTTTRGFDPSYQSGARVWEQCGAMSAAITDIRYGGFEYIGDNSDIFRAIVATLVVIEREMPIDDDFAEFEGVDLGIGTNESDTDPTVTNDIELDVTL